MTDFRQAIDTTDIARQERERIAVNVKLARIRRGEPIRVVDLFSGCGGMSLGFLRANYSILGGVEKDPNAARVHANNFFSSSDVETFSLHEMPRNINTFRPAHFMREVLKRKQPELEVDVIVGGPPCQAFARIGRAKLREISQHPEAHLNDDRASLYIQYLSYVDFFRPLAVLMENVPDIMNHGGQNVAENIAELLEEMGYQCKYTILNAANYGVPQMRQRFFLIALLNELATEPSFPDPTHFVQLTSGYISSYQAALNTERPTTKYISPPVASEDLLPAVSVADALLDLPPIRRPLTKVSSKGKLNSIVQYKDVEITGYIKELRNWEGFCALDEGVRCHVTRHLPRDYAIFQRMKPGQEYPEAHRIAIAIFKKNRKRRSAFGKLRFCAVLPPEAIQKRRLRKKEWLKSLKKATIPPYDPTKFPNKWWKLVPSKPSRTLTAHIGKDTYTHIHYDPKQPRVISVREAARLQSFPDGFKFGTSMNASFTQIGNAVPPLLSYKLAVHIKNVLENVASNNISAKEVTRGVLKEGMINIDDTVWKLIEPLLPSASDGSRRHRENRKHLAGILHVLQNDIQWNRMPEEYSHWQTCRKYHLEWQASGVWSQICNTLQILLGSQAGVAWDKIFQDHTRKRGRPRKHPIPTSNEAINEHNTENSSSIPDEQIEAGEEVAMATSSLY